MTKDQERKKLKAKVECGTIQEKRAKKEKVETARLPS